MTDGMLTIGWALFGMLFTFGLGEVYDAWKYRDHPNENVRRELAHWGTLSAICLALVGLSYLP